MTVKSLESQLSRALAHGNKLTRKEVQTLVASAKDQGKVSADEAKLLANLPPDAFAEPGLQDDLAKMLEQTADAAYVNLRGKKPASFGYPSDSGVSGVKLAFETGLGQLTQNCLELTGGAKKGGKLSVQIDGKTVTVSAKKGESAAALAAKIAKAMPAGYSAWANTGYGEDRATIQVFHHEAMPASLVKPVKDGKVPPVKILVTGYGKFGSITEDANNPSWQMAQKLAALKIPGAQVQAVLLPVEWSKVDEFAKTAIDKYHPDVVINLGYGRNTIEPWAENKTDGPDAAGVEHHGEPADPNGDEFLKTTLPVEQIEQALDKVEDASLGGREHLRAGEPGTASFDDRMGQAKQAQADDEANKYLCNYLNYRMLEVTRGQGIMSGFLHVDESTSPQELEAVLQQCAIAKLKEREQPATPLAPKPNPIS